MRRPVCQPQPADEQMLAGRARLPAQMGDEGPHGLEVPGLAQDARRLHERARLEVFALFGRDGRLRVRQTAVERKGLAGDLPVKRSWMAGRAPEPLGRLLPVAGRLCGARPPVGGAGAADRVAHPVVHGLEVPCGGLRPVQEPQGQPARQPFGLRERTVGRLPVLRGDGVGLLEPPALYRLADLVALLEPPVAGAAELRRRVEQQFARAGVLALEAAPADALEGEARMAPQGLRHLPDRPVHAPPALHQPEPRLPEPSARPCRHIGAGAGRHRTARPRATGRAGGYGLNAVERFPMPFEETPLEVLGKIAFDPGFAQQPAPGVGLSVRDLGLCETLLAGAAQRPDAGEPGARGPVRVSLRHRLFGAPDKRRAVRPVRMGLQERLDFGERYVGIEAPEALPLDHGRGKGMPGPFRAPGRLFPLAARGGIQCGPKRPPFGLAKNAVGDLPHGMGFARHGRRRNRGSRRACGDRREKAAGQRRADSPPGKAPLHPPSILPGRAGTHRSLQARYDISRQHERSASHYAF